VVISQVYASGGNSGASWSHDYVELHNAGDVPVTLDGASLQYGTATGAFNRLVSLSGTIEAGEYFLIRLSSAGLVGSSLDFVDLDGSMNLSATGGRIALVSTTVPLDESCTRDDVLDLIGYGSTATCFEGTQAAFAPTATNALFRINSGCQDQNDNRLDFETAPTAPRNSSTEPLICSCEMSVSAL
jgi:hypothetical protein